MTDPETPLRSLHEHFEKLTGRRYCYEQWRHDWYEYSKYYTADDLSMVLAFADRINKTREKRYQIVTSLRKIIGDLRTFDDLKAEAELAEKAKAAKKRQFVPSAGQIALSEMRREDLPQPPDEPAKRVSLDFVADSLRKAKQ